MTIVNKKIKRRLRRILKQQNKDVDAKYDKRTIVDPVRVDHLLMNYPLQIIQSTHFKERVMERLPDQSIIVNRFDLVRLKKSESKRFVRRKMYGVPYAHLFYDFKYDAVYYASVDLSNEYSQYRLCLITLVRARVGLRDILLERVQR